MSFFTPKKPQEEQNAELLQQLLETVNGMKESFTSLQGNVDGRINQFNEQLSGFSQQQQTASQPQPHELQQPENKPARLSDLSDEQLANYSPRELLMLQEKESREALESEIKNVKESFTSQLAQRDEQSQHQTVISNFRNFLGQKNEKGSLLNPDAQDWVTEVAEVFKQNPSLSLQESLHIAKSRNPTKQHESDLKHNLNQPAPKAQPFGGFPGSSSQPGEESSNLSLDESSVQALQDEYDTEGGIRPADGA